MRARTLKPEFFTDAKVARLDPTAALVYQGLWCMADDGGTAPCEPDRIKGGLFFRWSAIGVPEITGALRQLTELGFIRTYRDGDDEYANIPRFEKHQHVHKPSAFRYPTASNGAESPGTTAATSAGPPGTPPHPLVLRTTPSILESLAPAGVVPPASRATATASSSSQSASTATTKAAHSADMVRRGGEAYDQIAKKARSFGLITEIQASEYEQLNFRDRAGFKAVGGWRGLREVKADEEVWDRKRFAEAYAAAKIAGHDPVAAEVGP